MDKLINKASKFVRGSSSTSNTNTNINRPEFRGKNSRSSSSNTIISANQLFTHVSETSPDNLIDYVQMQEDYGIEDNNDEEIELDTNDTPLIPTSRVGQTKFTREEGSSRGGRTPLPELINRRRRSR
ncbi:hypothetical protein HAX54_025678, partial [Datura stramonium]|nr:hypothetical protein [Datura stramonium]